MQIKTPEADHISEWLRLRHAVYSGIDQEFHEQEINLFLQDASKACFLALRDDRQACGMVEVSLRNVVDGCLSSPVGYIEGIYVDPEYRGQRVAFQLLERAEKWCRSKGCTEVATDAELDNTAAQMFHQRMGFQETYRIVEFRKSL